MAVYSSSRYPSTLPESLRLRPGGLTTSQFSLYEDFVRMPRQLNGAGYGSPQGGFVGKEEFEGATDEPVQTIQAVEQFTVCVYGPTL